MGNIRITGRVESIVNVENIAHTEHAMKEETVEHIDNIDSYANCPIFG